MQSWVWVMAMSKRMRKGVPSELEGGSRREAETVTTARCLPIASSAQALIETAFEESNALFDTLYEQL
jgi:hypothetical protein